MADARLGRHERAVFNLAGAAHAVADFYFAERSGRAAGHELQRRSALDGDLLRLIMGTRHRNLVLVDRLDSSGDEGLAKVRRVHSLAALATHHHHIRPAHGQIFGHKYAVLQFARTAHEVTHFDVGERDAFPSFAEL